MVLERIPASRLLVTLFLVIAGCSVSANVTPFSEKTYEPRSGDHPILIVAGTPKRRHVVVASVSVVGWHAFVHTRNKLIDIAKEAARKSGGDAISDFEVKVKDSKGNLIVLGYIVRWVDQGEAIGGCIEGDCENGIGTFLYPEGEKYVGQWRDGVPHGRGVRFWPNGKVGYEGEIRNGKWHGTGKLYFKNGKTHYEGEFRQKYYEGHGILYFESGEKMYEGEFKESEYNGQGTLYRKNGSIIYKGELNFGEISGTGAMYDQEGRIIHQGQFERGKPHGQGISYGKDGSVLRKGRWYRGQFVE